VRWRNTAILFLVAVALGGALWWSGRQQSQKKEAEARAKRLFGDLEAGQVDWFSLQTKDGKPAKVARVNGAWRVVEPVDFPADATTADSIASTLAAMTSEAVIEEPQAPSVYGLGPDATTVHFHAAGKDYVLHVGKKTPVGANSYASTDGAKTVYTVATFKTTGFSKSLDDLRERRPLRFDRGDVTRIETSWPGGGVELAKSDGHWHITKPIQGDADDDVVETMLSDLVFLRAAGFIDDPPPDKDVGLDDPQWKVVLEGKPAKPGESPPRWELAIGGVVKLNARAGRAAEHALYEIPEDRFEKLPKTVDAFRFKELSRYVVTDAERFELSFADPQAAAQGQSRVVTIRGERSEDGWTTSPEVMGPGKAALMVADVAHLKADDIVADSVGASELTSLGLSPPQARIKVYGRAPAATSGEKKGAGGAPLLADLLIGVQKGDHIVTKRADRDTIFGMAASEGRNIPVSLDAFRNRFVSKESPAQKPSAAAKPSGPATPPAPAKPSAASKAPAAAKRP
jgi:hypothetical protein